MEEEKNIKHIGKTVWGLRGVYKYDNIYIHKKEEREKEEKIKYINIQRESNKILVYNICNLYINTLLYSYLN